MKTEEPVGVLALVLMGASVWAQAPTATRPQFEAASVKPSAPGAQGQSLRRQRGGQFSASNIPLLGGDLKKSAVDCDAVQLARLTAEARGAAAPPPVSPDGRPVCGFRGVPGGGPGVPGGIQAGGIPMWQLANLLPRFVERTVVDRTGLEGYYDWQLLFSPPRAAEQSGGSIFTALQEQMGLKLESTRAPVEVWVVDRLERPTPD